MRKNTIAVLVVGLLALSGSSVTLVQAAALTDEESAAAAADYQKYCALCHGDDRVAEFDNAAESNPHVGVFADASPAELQQLSKIDEAPLRSISKYLRKDFGKYVARLARLEKQLARRSKPESAAAIRSPLASPSNASPSNASPSNASPSNAIAVCTSIAVPDAIQSPANSPYGQPARLADPKPTPSAARPESPRAHTILTKRQPASSAPAQTWQRFNLNGQWFYIVPVEHVDAFTPSQAD